MKTIGLQVYTNPSEVADIDPHTIAGVPPNETVIAVECDGKNAATVECVTKEESVSKWRDHRTFLLVRGKDGPKVGPLLAIRRVWWGCAT